METQKPWRAQLHRTSKDLQQYAQRPPFLAGHALLQPSIWHFKWYADDSTLWSLLSMALQSLLVVVSFWDAIADVKSVGHSGPYCAVMLWRTERISSHHLAKLQTSTLTLCGQRDVLGELEQAAHQKAMSGKERAAALVDVKAYVNAQVLPRIRKGSWSRPTGVGDNAWKHWGDFKKELSDAFHGVLEAQTTTSAGWEHLCMLRDKPLLVPRGSICAVLNPDTSPPMSLTLPPQTASSSSAGSAPRVSDPTAEEVQASAHLIAEHASMVAHLRTMSWLGEVPVNHENDVRAIKRMFEDQYYPSRLQSTCDIFVSDEFPTSMVAWLSVCEQCMETIRYRNLWPKWFRRPRDQSIRAFANAAPDAFWDPGNVVLEIVWFALRFYRHVDQEFPETMLAPGLKPYGERSQRSSEGITNFRGNSIEGLLGHIAKISV